MFDTVTVWSKSSMDVEVNDYNNGVTYGDYEEDLISNGYVYLYTISSSHLSLIPSVSSPFSFVVNSTLHSSRVVC